MKRKKKSFSITNTRLLTWYNRGWFDECHGTTSVVPKKFERAYNVGVADYILGDDIPATDLQTNEEILEKIKK